MAPSPVQRTWRQIEWALYQFDPSIVSQLPAGVSDFAIAEAESVMGCRLPTDVKEFFKIHDGSVSPSFRFELEWSGEQGGRWQFHSLSKVVSNWKSLVDIGKYLAKEGVFSEPNGPINDARYHERWIPLTEDGGGDCHCLDLAPEEGGHVGQIIFWWHEVGATEVLANSFEDWFTQVGEGISSEEVKVHFSRR